ncbi:MAG TPA: PLP-dependent aspartate aminotransferase family protein [Thermoplasmata archaeon]|nr:PLP-dependent aspartate aminotransferase family protein [Thermoplasmata archaeon]
MSAEPGPPAEASAPRDRAYRPLPPWSGPTTRLLHGGWRPDYNAGSVVYPIYQTSTFHYPADRTESVGGTYLYSRNANPTVEGPEELLRQMEGGEAARLFASGMGAISATVLSLVRPGDEVVALCDLYGGTTDLLHDLRDRFGVRLREVADAECRAPESVLSPSTRLVLLETPTNPLLRVHDIARWSAAADRVGAVLAVDGTFAPPTNQQALVLGADLVMHSATKYLGGHSDLLGGVVVGPKRLLDRIDPRRALGATLDPFAAFLLHRSLKTLGVRVDRQNESGRRIAAALADHPAVAAVHYPGRASAEQEAIAARQMRGRGGVLSLGLRGGAAAVDRFLGRLELVHVASSFGGVESLASVPVQTSHRHLSPEELARRGIDAGLVRLSLGIEETADLLRDLTQALDAARAVSPPPL